MLDLRKEFRSLIDKHGHWLVLRQAIPGKKCACVNLLTKEGDSRCYRCFSTGYAFVDRFVKARKSRQIRLTQTLGAEQLTGPVQMSPTDAIFYFQHTTKPTQIDYVLEVALDPISNLPEKPYRVLSVYDISDVREQRERSGRIEYFAVTAELKAWPEFNING